MRPLKVQTQQENRIGLYMLIALLFCLFATSAYAADAVSVVTADGMLKRITSQFPAITRLVTAFAYVAGFCFILVSLFKLKRLSQMRTMMMPERSVAGPLVYMFVGAMLIWLPTTVRVGMSSFWVNPTPYGYLQAEDTYNEIIVACFMAVQLFGTVAFIKGLLTLGRLGQQGGHQGAMGKAMAHIVGGIFCINIYQFVKVVLNTIGVTITGVNG